LIKSLDAVQAWEDLHNAYSVAHGKALFQSDTGEAQRYAQAKWKQIIGE